MPESSLGEARGWRSPLADATLRIRKLLAKAEDPGCTPEEAAALTDKAAELIAKYGVDRALLAQRRPETDPVGDLVIDVYPPYVADKSGLLATVAYALRCRAVRRAEVRAGGTVHVMHLFGFASDLERVELLFTSLLVQAAYGMAATPVPWGEQKAAFRRSWLAGFAYAIRDRLDRTERQAAAEAPGDGPSMALVLADRSARVEAAVAEAYPGLRSAPRRRLGGSGGRDGYVAGQRADLGGTRVGRPARQAVTNSG